MTVTVPTGAHSDREPARGGTRDLEEVVAKADIGVGHLKRRLEQTVEGEVRFDAATKGLYATDASNFRQVPIGVVIPKTEDDVVAVHRACHHFGAPILARGGGTSLSGETVNHAVVMDFSKYLHRIGEPDGERALVKAQPGAINEEVNRITGKVGMVFGPDPSSHSRCTIGGNVGNNSCGIHSVQAHHYGPGPRTSDNVESLDVLTYDGSRFTVGVNEEDQLEEIIAGGGRKGEIYAGLRSLRERYADAIRARFVPVERMPRRVSGYNLDELLPERGFNVARALTGTEGTCATVLEAELKLTPGLYRRTLVVIAYDEVAEAADDGPAIQDWRPIGLELVDRRLIWDQQLKDLNPHGISQLPRSANAGGWLLVQFGADTREESVGRVREFCGWVKEEKGYDDDRIAVFESEQDGGNSSDIWQIRESGLGSTAFPPDGRDHWPGWEDSAVPPEHMGDYLRRLVPLYEKHGLRGAFYGHIGEGCLHSRISFDLRSAEGLRTYRSFMEEAADLCVSYGGSVSGEHGDGQQRAELLEKQYGPGLMEAMHEFKRVWDPDWKMNPGKVVDAYRFDENLKLGTDYNPWRPEVTFAYPEDDGDFAHAMLRCVGVGKCRVPNAETVMCPSYQVTREEKHSTRGRARLLYEMLEGDVITDGWHSEEVFDALDLCLACKGCTSDCPVHVDMPTYKAEFLHHHYRSPARRRPRYAYAFGYIDQAARLASLVPGVVNLLTHTPPFSRLAKAVAGISAEREIPGFAPLTLQRWFAARGGGVNPNGRRVVLWPDTFNNYFHTDVGVACVEALEAAGWYVIIPEGHVCCGRPLYDYGFLDQARAYLHRTIDVLRDEIRAGTPVVGMEPSCLAVFKDELARTLPHDDDAQRLRRSAFHFDEFLERFDVEVPRLEREALVWGHCHHKATGGIDAEEQILRRMGVEVNSVAGGCCGLAGSWGFEQGKYEISMNCGEQALLPAVRDAGPETIIVADGFSCKTQIEQAGTGRRALHVAQLMKMGRDHGADGRPDALPKAESDGGRPRPSARRRAARAGVGVLAGALAGAGVVAARQAVGRT